MLECMIIHYMDGTLSQVYKFLSGIMPEVIVLHGFLVLTMFYVTASSFSTNDQQLIAAYLLRSIYPSSRRLVCPEATHICPEKQMNVRFGKQMKIKCLSHKDCASEKICCWSNFWSKYSCQNPVFIVKLEGHSKHVQEDFQTNVNGKYEIALPCETCNELTAQNWTYSANDAQILEIKDKHSKVKRAETKNTPKSKKKIKTKTNKELAKNIKTVPKVTKKSPPAKSKYQKRKTDTKTAKKKHSKNNKKTLKSYTKKQGTPTKQIKINAKTTKTMKISDETKPKKIKHSKPTNKMPLTTVKRTKSTNEIALTTVKRTKPTKKMQLTTVKRTKPADKMSIVRTNPTKKIVLATVKRTKTTKETIPSVTKEEIAYIKAMQNNGLFKIKTKQEIPENGEVLGSTRKFHLLQDFNENTFMDKYQGVFPTKTRKNEVYSAGRVFKLEEEQNSTTEIIKRTKLTKKTALTTVTKPTNKMTMKTIKGTKPTNKRTQTTIKRANPTNKTALTTAKKTRPTKKMALTAVKKEKPTNKMALTISRTNPTKKIALKTLNRTKTAKETIPSVTEEEISSVKVTQNNSTKNIYGLFKIKTKQKIPENGEVLGSTRKFHILQDFNNITFMDKYQGVFPIKSRKNEVNSAGRLFKLEEELNSTTEIVKGTKLAKKTVLTTVTKPTNKMTMKTIKGSKPTNKMTQTTIKRAKPTNKTALTTAKKTRPTKKMALTTVKKEKPTNKMALTIVRTNPIKKIALTTVKSTKTTKETIPSVTKEEISSVKTTQNNSTKKFYEIFKIKTKQKVPGKSEVLGSTRKFHLLQDFNENTFMDKYQGVFPIKSRKNEVNSAGRLFKLEEEQNSTTEIVKRTKLTKETVLTTVTKPKNKMTIKIDKPTNQMTQTTIKRAKPTNKTALTTAKQTRPTKKMALTTVKKEKSTNKMALTIIKRTKPTNKMTQTTVKRTKPTKKMSVTTVKRTKPIVKTTLSVIKGKNPTDGKATKNSSKNFYGLFKIKKKQNLPENGAVLGTTKRKFPLLQEFGGNTFVDKYQGVYPLKPRKNEAISTGKLFNLEEQQSHTKETEKRTKPTQRLATKPTKKASLTAVKRTKPTKKMTLATVKSTKSTKETIPTVAKEEIPVVEKVMQNNSTKNFNGLFKIKAKQKLPENSEELVTTIRKFTPLGESNGNTPMSKCPGDFPKKPRKNEANSAGQLFNFEILPTLACAGLFLCVIRNQNESQGMG